MSEFLPDFLTKRNIPFSSTDSGLHYHITSQGNGDQAKAGDYVQVHYTGTFLDGKVFDSSVERGMPIVFQLGQGQVIPGWDEGISLFKEGGKGLLYVPPQLAYGEQGAQDVIPPNSSLKFDIELVSIMDEDAYKKWEAEENERRQKQIQAYVENQMRKELQVIAAYAKDQGMPFQMADSGLFYLIEQAGEGEKAEPGKEVSVHYTGRLLNGKVFDSSHQRNQPITFTLGQGKVIQGWEEGLALFRVGGKGRLIIPSLLGYGPRQMGSIPAESILLFDIELVGVN